MLLPAPARRPALAGRRVRPAKRAVRAPPAAVVRASSTRHQTGQLMSRATVDLQSVRFFLGYGLIFFTQNLITIAIVAIALVAIDWQLALIAFAVAPVLSITAFRYSRASHPVLKEVQQRVADVTTQAEENIVGVRVVKAFAQEPRQLRSFAAGTERIFSQAILAARLQATYVPVHVSRSPTWRSPGSCWWAATRSSHGAPQPGRVLRRERLPAAPRRPAAVDRHVGRPVPARDGVGRADLRGARLRARHPRRGRTRETARTRARRHPHVGRRLRLRPRPARAARTSTSTSRPGSTVALIGPTGCGKTTLTTLIPRFYDVAGGVDRCSTAPDVRDAHARSLRAAVGIVSQDTFLFSTTVAENIAFGDARGHARADRDGGPPGAGPRVHLRPARRLRDASSASAASRSRAASASGSRSPVRCS